MPDVKRVAATLLAVVVLLAAGCDSGDDTGSSTTTIPGGADPAKVVVIDDWAKALTAGDIDRAASYFAIPSLTQNAGPKYEIADEGQARSFNASLPCGAILVEAHPSDRFVIATFRLTERPGPGTCGDGVGHKALTAFEINDDGKISQWLRVVASPGQSGPNAPGTSI
ncbi:MAG: hypothetical protein ACJ75R_09490 [Solirubrobacterales bacterium]